MILHAHDVAFVIARADIKKLRNGMRRASASLLLALLALVGISVVHAQEKRFPPDAVINVTLPPYNVRPDQDVDNTAAIQQAITDNLGTGRVLYFPAGTYIISDTLVSKGKDGRWKAMLTFQGENRDKTFFKLKIKSIGFNDKLLPKAMLMTGSMEENGDNPNGGGNKAFRNNIFDLTFDTGTDNPGAVGIEYAVSNQGAIENVAIRSEDGEGIAGISLKRKIPGPGLIKNVRITGFDFGIDVGDMEYGITLEDIGLQGQRIAGIRNSENVLYIRLLQSQNQVPAVLITKPNGFLLMLDSMLYGGAPDQYAIDCHRNLFLRNVVIKNYREAPVRCDGADLKPSQAQRYDLTAYPSALGASPNTSKLPSGRLPVSETPTYWNGDLHDWVAVGPRLKDEQDDTAAIQRAIDSGKGTVYFPNNRTYFISDTVVVRGAARQILGMGSEISLGAAKVPFGDRDHPRPLFRIDPPSGEFKFVFIEGLFFNAQYPGEVLFENNSPAALTIKHCMGWVGAEGYRRSYRNTPMATGNVYLEDVFLPGWEFTQQKVWARQFNPENPDGDGITPQVTNNGGSLWILGFKTEGPAPFLTTIAGGTTELHGAYNYVSATNVPKVPVEAVPYSVTNAKAALTFVSDNFRDNDYRVYIRETQGTAVHEWKGSDLAPRDGSPGDRSFSVPLYCSGNLSSK